FSGGASCAAAKANSSQKQPFMHAAASVSLGSKETFAARCADDRSADLVTFAINT
ncbi:MAG: hypothetical protein ACI9TA_002602, partial [Reinekea sp.]